MARRDLEGKQILITGAARGLGRALALDFARAGAAGLLLAARDRGALERVAAEARTLAPGLKAWAVAVDLAEPGAAERLAAATAEACGGKLDALVNNASTLGPAPMPYLVDYPASEFRRVLEVNLLTPFLLIQKLLPALLEARGSVINVTSDAGVNGYPGWGAYGISKFGLEGLGQTWAAELEDSGVRVNWVDPGGMDTDMHRAAEPDGDPSEWADPATVTGVFRYLASDAARGVHGRRFLAQDPRWTAAGLADAETTALPAGGP